MESIKRTKKKTTKIVFFLLIAVILYIYSIKLKQVLKLYKFEKSDFEEDYKNTNEGAPLLNID